MEYDQTDIGNVALCIWREARGEGGLGMQAVLNVIYNRAKDWGKSLHDVIFGKNQFTSMSVSSDPEFRLQPTADDHQFAEALQMSSMLLLGTNPLDVTNGAHYYANLKDSTSGWFFKHIVADTVNHPLTATIGHQNFYK